MLKKQNLRILDANFNRAREGLRVVEDILRYGKNKEDLFKKIKNIRHRLSSIMFKYYPLLVKSRNIKEDPGYFEKEKGRRKNLNDICLLYTSPSPRD